MGSSLSASQSPPDPPSPSSSSGSRVPPGLFRPDLLERGENPGGSYRLLTEEEAVGKATELVREWRPVRDVWSLRYGAALPTLAAGLPALLLTTRIRAQLFVPPSSGGRLFAAAVGAYFPLCVAYIGQRLAVQDLMVFRTRCPVCLEVRTTSFQLLAGSLMSTALTILGNHTHLVRKGRAVPAIASWDFLPWVLAVARRNQGFLACSAAAQAVLVAGLLRYQYHQWAQVNAKLLERMEKFKDYDSAEPVRTSVSGL